MFTIKSGWSQGVWTVFDQRLVMIIMTGQAAVRGADYIRGSGMNSPDYALLLAAFPAQIIGFAYLIPAVLIAVGMGLGVHLLGWLGHGLLAVTYGVTAGSVVLSIFIERPFNTGWLLILALATLAVGWVAIKGVIPPPNRIRATLGLTLVALLLLVLFLSPQVLNAGLRFPGHLLAVGTMHFLWAIRMGPVSIIPEQGEAIVVEDVIAKPASTSGE